MNNLLDLNNINGQDMENVKQFLNMLKSEQGKMIMALSCDENTLENIEEIEKQIDKMDDNIYSVLVGCFCCNILSGNHAYQNTSSELLNFAYGVKFLGDVFGFSDKYNLKNMFGAIGSSNMTRLNSVLNERRKLEEKKKSLLNDCIQKYEKQMSSKESQDLLNIISESMENNRKRHY